jgi:hypothetical protein
MRWDTELTTVPGAVRLSTIRPAPAATTNSSQMLKPGGTRIGRWPRTAQATIRQIIGMASSTHMKSATPSAHHSG